MNTPKVFISHSSKDKLLATKLATNLRENGINAWFDKWEILPGDSLRRKIDEGISGATHFIVLLTVSSLKSEWVQTEIDTAMVQRIGGQCRLIPVLHEINFKDIPMTLRGISSVSIDDYSHGLKLLVDACYGMSQKPPLANTNFEPPLKGLPLSPNAQRLAALLCKRSETGLFNDPILSIDEIEKELTIPQSLIEEAAAELKDEGSVEVTHPINAPIRISATNALYWSADEIVMGWNTENDTKAIASVLVSKGNQGVNLSSVAELLGWQLRRINPAATFLVEKGLAEASKVNSRPQAYQWLRPNAKTRRFASQVTQQEKSESRELKANRSVETNDNSISTIVQKEQAKMDNDEIGLSDIQKRLLQSIYNHFRESATWPTYRALEIVFREVGPLHEIVSSIDRRLVRVEDIYREDAVCYLTLEGLAHCDGASKDIQAIVDTAALFAKCYIEKKGSANITSDELKNKLGLTELEVMRVCEMYWRFGWYLRGGGGRSNEGRSCNFVISRNALLFDGVKTLDDFYACIKNAEQKEEAERQLNAPVNTPSSMADLLNLDYNLPPNIELGSLPQEKVRNKPKPFYKRWQLGVLITLLGVFVAALTPLKNIYDAQPKIHVRAQILISGFRENGYPIGRVFAVFKNTGSSMVTLEPMVVLNVFDKNGKSTREDYLMFKYLPFNPSNPGKSIPGEPQAIQPGEEVTAENVLMDLSEISEPIDHIEVKFITIKGQKCYSAIPLSTYFSSSKIQMKPGVQYGPTAGAKSYCQWSL